MSIRQSFSNSPDSVTRARRFATAALAEFPGSMTDSVALVVSELATNSIRHARTGFVVEIEVDNEQVRVAITDTGQGEPAMKSPAPHDTSGRGLRIVEEFSDDWGITPANRGTGKTVWFAVRRPQARAGG